MLVSVVVPTYNRAHLIERCLHSILNQTYSDLEIIVVDDCSTDNTQEIVNAISDSRIKYYRLEHNSGACAARNFGIDKSQGEYIAFQDSDDVWMPKKVELQIKELLSKKSNICVCGMKTIDTVTNESFYNPKSYCISYNDLLIGNQISTQMLVCHKSVFKRFRFDTHLPRFQDWDLVLSICKEYEITYVKDILVIQYIQSDSITKSSEKMAKSYEMIYRKHIEDFKKNKRAHIKILKDISRTKTQNGLDATEYYVRLFRIDHSIVNLIKLIFNYFGLMSCLYKWVK